MKVLGIDPAPSKKSVVFDGEKFKEYNAFELKELLAKTENTLICWDAPLAFDANTNDFYYRPIELFFKANNKKVNEYQIVNQLPKGISILPIAGCPHWLISQYVVGYPAINSNNSKIPLIIKKEDLTLNKTQIVEVHPALAIWIKLKNKINSFLYKKNKTDLHNIINQLNIPKHIKIKNDDYLDAYIAWELGTLFINSPHEVMLLGNKNGSILLPYDEELKNRFKKFILKVENDYQK